MLDRLNRTSVHSKPISTVSLYCKRELVQLKKQEEELSQQLLDLTTKLEQISALENTQSAAALKQESAQKTLQAAQHAKEIRQEMLSTAENAAKAPGNFKKAVQWPYRHCLRPRKPVIKQRMRWTKPNKKKGNGNSWCSKEVGLRLLSRQTRSGSATRTQTTD